MSHYRTFPQEGGLTAFVVDRPGRVLTLSAQWRIYDALVPVTTRSFGADMTPYWAQRSKEGYLERLAEFVLIASPEGRMIGWTGFHVLPYDRRTLVYLDSTGMVPEQQSRGVMRKVMRERIHEAVLPACRPDLPVYLTARSESPVFYRLMRGLLQEEHHVLHPHPSLPVPEDVADSALDMATWLGQGAILDRTTLAIRGAYDGLDELYGELPTTGDADLDKLFRGQLGPLDAYLLAGRVR
ncbi:GNAT family N-acetyltransferase [Actinosynnema sp.]|uniref:GNAT family N-acetyltransferase n=1 Tax=Actinosynnema sp. TaxID=1872144 RepID=UPI000AFD76EF